MAQKRGLANRITNLVVLALFAATLIASACLWWLGNWETHAFWLILTLRIIWGVFFVILLAAGLTKVTIFGWSFRKYFRWYDEEPPPPDAPRPTRAPWSKSPASSFGITVSLVSVIGTILLATVVLWILEDVIGPWVFKLVFGILMSVLWVTVIALVLVRITIFQRHREKALREQQANGSPLTEGTGEKLREGPPPEDPSQHKVESRS